MLLCLFILTNGYGWIWDDPRNDLRSEWLLSNHWNGYLRIRSVYIYIDIPSSKLTQLWKTTMLLMGKSTMNGYFQ